LPYVSYERKVLIHKGTRVKPAGVPGTVGEHILRKRLADRLDRKDLARLLGVDMATIQNWELGRITTVSVRAMPAVIRYLGYNPEPRPEGVGAQLRWKRRSLGWTTREAARRNSVDPCTWEAWETQTDWPKYPRYRALLQEFLTLPSEQLQARVRQVAPPAPRSGRHAHASRTGKPPPGAGFSCSVMRNCPRSRVRASTPVLCAGSSPPGLLI
jgi:transcriptional regulator with XRE-family HTH domain